MKILITLFVCCLYAHSAFASGVKINGISLVSSRNQLTQENVDPVVKVGANYTAIMPFGFMQHLADPKLAYNTRRQWYGGRLEGTKSYIQQVHTNNIRVMLKPQIWISGGKYTGFIEMNSEQDWQQLEQAYSAFILDYAKVAQDTKVAIFCIGTELEQFVAHRPEYWFELVKNIKSIYTGKLTYAANWDEYKRTPFWQEMDFIGIDGYFPTSTLKTPTVESIKEGWKPWKKALSAFSQTHSKPILFTEWGYRSVDFAAKEPWKSDHGVKTVNLEAQTHAIEGTFQSLWQEEWFAGGFVWKWFIHHQRSGGAEDNRFTPQNKPAENIIRAHFSSE